MYIECSSFADDNETLSAKTTRRRLLSSESESGRHTPGRCADSVEVLEDILAPYLYPIVIEFALIAAAILYKIHSNIGKIKRVDHGMEYKLDPTHQEFSLKAHAECHKANTGIFLGLLVLVANIMVTIVYLSSSDETMKEWLYMLGDISMQCTGIITILFAFCQTTKLDYNGKIENKIDMVLLLVTVSGLYTLMFCSLIPYIFDEIPGKWLWVWILEDISNFVQATLQMIFIFDSCQREAGTKGQWHHKPGRSFISFLLFCNLSMWLINSFQMKEALVLKPMIAFYGSVAWTIILYLSLPLSVFFRFHSVVCLSDIWVEAYPKKFKQSREAPSGDGAYLYNNPQLQGMQNRLRAAEETFLHRVTQISNTNGDNTI